MKKIFTIEDVKRIEKNWLNGTNEKAKRAWRRLLRDIENK